MSGKNQFVLKKRYVIYLALCLIALYVVIPQISAVKGSLPLVRSANKAFVVMALAAALFSYIAAAGVYVNLGLKPLRFGRTMFVQFAAMFVNRLLPAGLGGMGINYLYLRKNKHTATQATTVVAANNTLGFIGHAMLVTSLVALGHASLPWDQANKSWQITIGLLVLMAALIFLIPKLKQKFITFIKNVGAQLIHYRKRPINLISALACSLLITSSNVMALHFSSLAVGVELSLVAILLIFTFGLSVGTATPTPGSLGGIEAGLVAGMLAYNVEPAPALAAVLTYRVVSYWLPLLLGASIFVVAQKRRYF